MTEAGEGTATIHVVYLESGARYDLTVEADEDSLQVASFLGNSSRIVVLGKDVENNNAFLGIYALQPEGLVEENRLAEFPGMVVKQFSISPDGVWIAIILADTAGAQSLYLLDVQNSTARELLPAEDQEMLITEPAWTEDGKWFVINRCMEKMNCLITLPIQHRAVCQP
jgi:Tol biopolymer transport system component